MKPPTFKQYIESISPETFMHEALSGVEQIVKTLILDDEIGKAGDFLTGAILEHWQDSYDVYVTDLLESQGPL